MGTKKKADKPLKLKPGNHQFIAGAHSFHNNDNTSPEELAWYLKQYPHIENMLEKQEETTEQSDESQE